MKGSIHFSAVPCCPRLVLLGVWQTSGPRYLVVPVTSGQSMLWPNRWRFVDAEGQVSHPMWIHESGGAEETNSPVARAALWDFSPLCSGSS